jgi:thiol-disulfide isomerase/thioredoxin
MASFLGLCPLAGTTRPADSPKGVAGKASVASPSPPKLLNRTDITVDAKAFGEGWRQTVSLKAVPGDAYDIWVKDGWLHVKRYNASSGLDWHIILARVTGSEFPKLSTIEGAPFFELSYGDGRYFIRDTFHALRSLRQHKREDQCPPRHAFLDPRLEPGGRCVAQGPTHVLSSWKDKEWVFAACGPTDQRFDALVRLDPAALEGAGHGFQSFAGGLTYFFHGNTWIMDDGELLVASRTLDSAHRMELVRAGLRQKLSGAPLPVIHATSWLNSQSPLTWDRLKGKVVLVDFWGVWCEPCVKKLPVVQRLALKYASQGLVVIGIHSHEGSDRCKAFISDHHISFPIAIDAGTTAEAFAITDWPTLFLIDKTGKVVIGYSKEVPDEGVITTLLGQ